MIREPNKIRASNYSCWWSKNQLNGHRMVSILKCERMYAPNLFCLIHLGIHHHYWLLTFLVVLSLFLVFCFHCSGTILFGRRNISIRFSYWRNWWSTISITKLTSSWILIHYVCACTLDNCDFGTVCGQSVSAAFLIDFLRDKQRQNTNKIDQNQQTLLRDNNLWWIWRNSIKVIFLWWRRWHSQGSCVNAFISLIHMFCSLVFFCGSIKPFFY